MITYRRAILEKLTCLSLLFAVSVAVTELLAGEAQAVSMFDEAHAIAEPTGENKQRPKEYIIEEDRIEPIADNSQAQLNLVLIIAAVMLGSIVLAAGIVTIVKRKK